MTNQIKPRYRLGTQNMLDLAKDDATKIPERTLFRCPKGFGDLSAGAVVVRNPHADESSCNDDFSVSFRNVADLDVANDNFEYLCPKELQPLI